MSMVVTLKPKRRAFGSRVQLPRNLGGAQAERHVARNRMLQKFVENTLGQFIAAIKG